MRVEREIAGIAFPFAAGVMAAVIIEGSLGFISTTYHIASLWTTVMSAIALFMSMKRGWDPRMQWGLIWACTLSCGVFVGLNGLELKISDIAADGYLAQTAHRWAGGLEELIESIPFENSSTGEIIKALLTGNREDIPPEVTQAFRDSGASHILALSGLHLGIIYIFVVKGLSLIGNSIKIRILRSLLTIAICGAYTLATGAGASITRAFIFITMRETAKMTGRSADLKGILASSLLLHLAFDPTAAAEIGFQLSYAAMFGIAYIYPKLKSMWRNDWPLLRKIWDSAALSISCQATTGPPAYYYFGTFPKYFLLTNLLAAPLAGIIIPAALTTVLLTALGCCPDIIINITEWLTTTLTDILKVIASM